MMTPGVVSAGVAFGGFSRGDHLNGQALPLLGRQLLGRTTAMNRCRSWPVQPGRSRGEITRPDLTLCKTCCYVKIHGSSKPARQENRVSLLGRDDCWGDR